MFPPCTAGLRQVMAECGRNVTIMSRDQNHKTKDYYNLLLVH